MAIEPNLDVRAILDRLGLDGAITVDVDGLRRLYRAWCLGVPFGNLEKFQALLADPNGRLPGLNAEEFFEGWLAHGTGGTCWAHGNAIYSLFRAVGFDARRATASMFDFGDPNHSTVLIHLPDGSVWLVDNSLLTMQPLRIDEPGTYADSIHYAEVEHDGDQRFVHGTSPPMPHIFFRLLDRDTPFSTYQERYEVSRGRSIFNDRIHIRRNLSDRVLVIRGRNLHTLDADGRRSETLDAAGLTRHLVETMGLDPAYVRRASKAIEVSIEVGESGPVDVPVRVAPSKRESA